MCFEVYQTHAFQTPTIFINHLGGQMISITTTDAVGYGILTLFSIGLNVFFLVLFLIAYRRIGYILRIVQALYDERE